VIGSAVRHQAQSRSRRTGQIRPEVPRHLIGEQAGEGGELAGLLARVPTGRLVVLGEPGAGKTMLMVRLALDLLGCRASGSPVPYLASVASWDPAAQDLRDWLGSQLLTDHPALASSPPEGIVEPTRPHAGRVRRAGPHAGRAASSNGAGRAGVRAP